MHLDQVREPNMGVKSRAVERSSFHTPWRSAPGALMTKDLCLTWKSKFLGQTRMELKTSQDVANFAVTQLLSSYVASKCIARPWKTWAGTREYDMSGSPFSTGRERELQVREPIHTAFEIIFLSSLEQGKTYSSSIARPSSIKREYPFTSAEDATLHCFGTSGLSGSFTSPVASKSMDDGGLGCLLRS